MNTTEAQIQHFVDQPWTIKAGRDRERMLSDARRWFKSADEALARLTEETA